jgi:hypothetical protein
MQGDYIRVQQLSPEVTGALEILNVWVNKMASKGVDAVPRKIPPSLIGVVGRVLANEYTHDQLDMLFLAAGFPEEIPAGSKMAKLLQWQRIANKLLPVPLAALGRAIAEFMDQPEPSPERLADDHYLKQEWNRKAADMADIREALARDKLSYHRGGTISLSGVSGASKTLEQRLREQPIETVQEEFEQTIANVDTHPRQAVDAACALLESTCKFYLGKTGTPLPKDQSIMPLWNATAKGLGLDPARMEDDDLKKILSGLYSIAGGIGAFRTHAGGAHGRAEPESGQKIYQVAPRHARLAVHAAHTLALFVLETWEARGA